MPTAVAARYAQALVDTLTAAPEAPQARDPQAIVAQVEAFNAVLRDSADLGILFSTPAISRDRKKQVLQELALRLGLDSLTKNFLLVVLQHERINLLGEIAESVRRLLDERSGITVAEITSARPLDEAEKQQLSEALRARTGRQVRMQFRMDQALIGGIVARIGSTIYDGSVRGQLERLRAELVSH